MIKKGKNDDSFFKRPKLNIKWWERLYNKIKIFEMGLTADYTLQMKRTAGHKAGER